MPRQTDDQAARARYAEQAGRGARLLTVRARPTSSASSTACSIRRRGRRCARALAERRFPNGAPEAAEWLAALARREAAPRTRTALGGGICAGRWPRHARRHPSSPACPSTSRPCAKQTIQRPAPRTLVLALGTDDAALEVEPPRCACRGRRILRHAFSWSPIRSTSRPCGGRASASSTSRLPARRSRPWPAATTMTSACRRLELILAERRRPRRAVATGRALRAAPAAASLPGS